MFTVKVREERNGVETVFEATQVRKALNEVQGSGQSQIGEVRCDLPGGGTVTYAIRVGSPANGSDDMKMFVMNRFGATVATYDL